MWASRKRRDGLEYIPAPIVAELIQRWRRNGNTLSNIAFRTGIPERTLYAIVIGERELTQFKVVDSLLTGMDCVSEWYSPPLSDYYARQKVA